MDKLKMYFAHPINVYDTELERTLLALIARRFPTWEIVNPNAPEHAAGYRAQGMDYFLKKVLLGCDECVLLAFRDGMIPKGVYSEAETTYRRRRLVWEVWPDKDKIDLWCPKPARCLTVEETRARIRNPDGTIKPY